MQTVRRGRLAEYAYDYTKQMLFDGRLAPGAKLRVDDVVASLQISRQPVMDAFKRLAAEGYLEIKPQVGCRVVVPDRAEIADFFLIFGAVQGLAADIGAIRRTPNELAMIASIAAAVNELADQPATAQGAQPYNALDREFQQQIRLMAHSEAVAPLSAALLDRRNFYIACVPNGLLIYAQRVSAARTAYTGIVAALAAADADAARARTEALILSLACSTQNVSLVS